MSYLLIDLNSIYKSVLKEFDSFSKKESMPW